MASPGSQVEIGYLDECGEWRRGPMADLDAGVVVLGQAGSQLSDVQELGELFGLARREDVGWASPQEWLAAQVRSAATSWAGSMQPSTSTWPPLDHQRLIDSRLVELLNHPGDADSSYDDVTDQCPSTDSAGVELIVYIFGLGRLRRVVLRLVFWPQPLDELPQRPQCAALRRRRMPPRSLRQQLGGSIEARGTGCNRPPVASSHEAAGTRSAVSAVRA